MAKKLAVRWHREIADPIRYERPKETVIDKRPRKCPASPSSSVAMSTMPWSRVAGLCWNRGMVCGGVSHSSVTMIRFIVSLLCSSELSS